MYFLDHPQYNSIGLTNLRNDDGWNHWPNGICESGYICSLWIHVNGIKDLSLVKKLDILVDGIEGDDAGDLRYVTAATPYFTGITLRYSPIKNLNN